MAKPAGPKERIDLKQAFRAAQTEVRVDHLHLMAADLDGSPQGTPRLTEAPVQLARQGFRLHQGGRPDRQDRIAVFLLHHL